MITVGFLSDATTNLFQISLIFLQEDRSYHAKGMEISNVIGRISCKAIASGQYWVWIFGTEVFTCKGF